LDHVIQKPIQRESRMTDWNNKEEVLGAVKLDFAIIQGERKLDIEIDGESYHRDWSQGRMRRDIIRNHRLIEDGWDIMRIWVYQLKEDPDIWIGKIKEWMAKE